MVSDILLQNLRQCPLCARKDIKLYSKLLFIWKCPACGLLFKDIAECDSDRIYKNAWRDQYHHENETGGTDLKLSRIYSQKLISFLGLKNLIGLKILDFGAGRGDMLIALSELGADVYGVEPFGYDYLKSANFKVFRDIDDIPNGLFFDGVIANDVIEHLFYPLDKINKLYNLLNDTGWLYIATPNAESLNAKFFMSYWREFYNPSHIRFFSEGCIESIFEKIGIASYKRLHWFIKYNSNPIQKLVHFLLQYSQLDGVLRYMLRKS